MTKFLSFLRKGHNSIFESKTNFVEISSYFLPQTTTCENKSMSQDKMRKNYVQFKLNYFCLLNVPLIVGHLSVYFSSSDRSSKNSLPLVNKALYLACRAKKFFTRQFRSFSASLFIFTTDRRHASDLICS